MNLPTAKEMLDNAPAQLAIKPREEKLVACKFCFTVHPHVPKIKCSCGATIYCPFAPEPLP